MRFVNSSIVGESMIVVILGASGGHTTLIQMEGNCSPSKCVKEFQAPMMSWLFGILVVWLIALFGCDEWSNVMTMMNAVKR